MNAPTDPFAALIFDKIAERDAKHKAKSDIEKEKADLEKAEHHHAAVEEMMLMLKTRTSECCSITKKSSPNITIHGYDSMDFHIYMKVSKIGCGVVLFIHSNFLDLETMQSICEDAKPFKNKLKCEESREGGLVFRMYTIAWDDVPEVCDNLCVNMTDFIEN